MIITYRSFKFVLSLAVLVPLVPFAMAGEAPAKLPTPPEVWKDYDPDKGDFKEQIVSEETKGGIHYRDTYISAYVRDEEIRVYCKYAVKAGVKNAPGLLNVHGWMSMASIDPAYVNDGWAVLSFDYCGKTGDRKEYTKYPEKLRYGNMDAKTGYRVKSRLPDGKDITDPKQTDDYLWYAIQRRALSYLLAQKEVDSTRIGAKGFSYGGTLMWNLGMDPRVKAVVAYFGIGWIDYYRDRGVYMYQVPYVEPKKTPGEELILSAIAPEAHAPYITAASLWLNGSNDHHGGHERGIETFKKFKPGVPWSFAIQARGHHDTNKLGDNCKLWLEKHVLGTEVNWPAHPKSEIKLDADGVPELRVTPASSDEIVELSAYYALKEPVSFGRNWHDAKTVCDGDTWVAKMPVINVDDYVFGFANIRYKNNIVLSTDFNAAIPAKLGKAVATDKPSHDLSEGGTGAWSDVAPVEGVGGVKAFRPVNKTLGTASGQFNDPKWKAPANASFSFRFYCTQPQSLLLVVNDLFEAPIEITAAEEWQTMIIPSTKPLFRANKAPLGDWSKARHIRIKPQAGADITQVIFGDFKWVLPEPAKPKAAEDGTFHLTAEIASKAASFNHLSTDKAYGGNAIKIAGKTYERGLGVHAPSEIVFPLDGKFGSFHVVPGPDDGHRGYLEMKILVDGKEVYASGKVRSGEFKPEPLDLPVTGAKTLALIVTDGGDGNGGDHASWADACLIPVAGAAAKENADPATAAPAPTVDAPESLPHCTAETVPRTVDELWAGYDPRKEPLEVTVIREWDVKAGDKPIKLQLLSFTAGTFKGKTSRIGAYFAYPADAKGKIPGLVQVHGGGQRAERAPVMDDAAHGYASLSINWGGRPMDDQKEGDPVTDWGAINPTQTHVSRTPSIPGLPVGRVRKG